MHGSAAWRAGRRWKTEPGVYLCWHPADIMFFPAHNVQVYAGVLLLAVQKPAEKVAHDIYWNMVKIILLFQYIDKEVYRR